MTYVLQNAHWFVLLIGALVFFHELGHFLVAKACNVQVVKFSLGFGPKLVGFTYGETEYTLSLLPLGGFVKMAGEEPEAGGHTASGRGLADKPLWQRALIVVAGPASNLAFAFVVYLSMFAGEHTFGDTKLGVVAEGEPAFAGGLRPGDRITAVDGEPVEDWDALQAAVGGKPNADLRVTYERDGHPFIAPVHAGERQELDPFGQMQPRGKVGISLQYVLPIVAVVDAGSPAAAAGLSTGDRIEAVGTTKVAAWHEVRTAVAAAEAGHPIVLHVQRGGEALVKSLAPTAFPQALQQSDRQSSANAGGQAGYTGLVALESVVSAVRADSPAAKAGIVAGDRLLTAIVSDKNGQVVRHRIGVWSVDLPSLGLTPGGSVALELQRGASVQTANLAVAALDASDEYHQVHHGIDVGLSNDANTLDTYTRTGPVGLWRACMESGKQVGADMSLIGRGIAKMVSGSMPLGNMGGPIMLFVIAEKSAKRGWDSFGRAMAMTSVNLGMLNILPVPVLDGGHLLFFAYEAIARRPPSLRVREYANMVGLGALLLLMVLVFRNDIVRFLLG